MAEQKCIKCDHLRTGHSKEGCKEWTNPDTGEECKCKVKYTEQDKFR